MPGRDFWRASAIVTVLSVVLGSPLVVRAQIELHPALRLVNQLPIPDGLEDSLGDLMFSADGATAYFIDNSEASDAAVSSGPVLRDPDGTVTGFGPMTFLFSDTDADTGLEFAPGSDTLFYRGLNGASGAYGIAQRTALGAIEYKDLLGAGEQYGGLAFLPAQYQQTGLVTTSYETGMVYHHSVTDDLDGTFTIGNETVFARPEENDVLGDPEFVLSGYFANHLIMAIYDQQDRSLIALELDPVTGLPVDGTDTEPKILASGVDGAWGTAIDPVTGHLWLIDFGAGPADLLIQIESVGIFVDGFESGDTTAWSSSS